MKINNLREKFLIFGVYSLLVVSALGSFIGTYSWFEYRERASVRFNGTSLSDSLEIDIGLQSAVDLPEANEYGLIQDVHHEDIYWSTAGLSFETLDYFLRANGYATNVLVPVSSGAYTTGDDLALKSRPVENSSVVAPANKEEYCVLPLVFKAVNNYSTLTNYDIVLQKVSLKTDGQANEAFRIHFAGSNQENFLFSPTSDVAGLDTVGGPLDLGRDGYLDYDNVSKKEFFYGEAASENIYYLDTPSGHEDVLPEEERTVNNAVHKEGSYAIDFSKTIAATSTYLGKNEVVRNNRPVCSGTSEEYAKCTMSLYFEGWNEDINEKTLESKFDLTLTFSLANV